MGLDDIRTKCGIQTYIFLSIHIQILYLFIVMCVFGLPALIPVYFYGSGMREYDVNPEAIANILEDNDKMIAGIMYFIFFSILGYFLVYKVLRSASTRSMSFVTPAFEYFLEVKGFPADIAPDKMKKKIEKRFTKQFGDKIVGVYVVPDLTMSYIADLKMQEAKEKLDHFRAIENE